MTDRKRLFGHNHHVSWLQPCALYATTEQTTGTANHRAIGAHYEHCLLIGQFGGTACLIQIPSRVPSRLKRDCGRVVHGTIDDYHIRPFGDIDRIASTHGDISGRVGPALRVARNVDYQPTRRSDVLQFFQGRLILQHYGLLRVLLIPTRSELHFRLLSLYPPDQIRASVLLHLPDLDSFKNCSVGISVGTQAAGALDDGTEALSILDTVGSGMKDFAIDLDGGADILPSGELADGENVAIAQPDISVRFASQDFGNIHIDVVTHDLAAFRQFVAREVCLLGVGAAFEPPCHPNQIRRTHVVAQWIFARASHFAFNRHYSGICFR